MFPEFTWTDHHWLSAWVRPVPLGASGNVGGGFDGYNDFKWAGVKDFEHPIISG